MDSVWSKAEEALESRAPQGLPTSQVNAAQVHVHTCALEHVVE